MSEIPKAYEPQSVEDKWYDFWVKHGCFTADPARVSGKRLAYSIVIPPPNVTGVLTMGHVLNNTIQDILARKARMAGKEVLWLPGTDHAGIATQTVVERTLKKEGTIKHRDDLGREKFLEKVWEWKEKHGSIIIQQLKKLGCSCDWTRERFTMDLEYSRCVQKVFVDLYQKGLIYRGKRMVNWCPVSQTALSDEEVIMKEQQGFLYYFKVEVAEQPGTFLTIATTRPETIPGDTAVAVNPKDTRYAHLIGKHVVRPLPAELPREQKLIPIVADDHIDPEFGTGVLKVTPAHDQADFEIGQRHNLPLMDIMEPTATMNQLAGADLQGLDRFKARKVAAEKLKEIGALDREEPYTNKVGFSERADVPIEPRLSEQWFMKYPSAEASRQVVAEGRMKFYPDRWAKVYDHWMENIQDWCISRQLWWGHRIPVWSRTYAAETEMPPAIRDAVLQGQKQPCLSGANGAWSYVGGDRIAQWIITAATCFDEEAKALEQLGFTQDPDVLDTWCSSWLWPFATMGWTGDEAKDAQNTTLKTFYPTTDLVTGPDIIFFWVARMIMAGYEYMKEMPFRNVYFTGIIRDKLGRKMSKSLGNSPDPLDLIHQYGADALRFGVMRAAPLGQDILFDEQNVELGRNFCNKLWNACRFRQMQGGATEGEIDPALLTSDDKWILLKLDQAIREIDTAFAEYRFNEVTQTLYRFFWSEYCDWYVEASKAMLSVRASERQSVQSPDAPTLPRSDAPTTEARRANKLAVIDFVLGHMLRLFHPFLPFITEELWHGMGFDRELPADQGGQTIMFARWPKPLDDDFKNHYGLDESDERFVNAKYELVGQGRNLRREGNIPSSKKVKFVFKPAGAFPEHEAEVLKLLLNADTLEVAPTYDPPKGTPTVRSELGELWLPLEGLIDVAAEKARLIKEIAKVDAEIDKVRQRLNNPGFVEKVPPAVLEEHKNRLAAWEAKRAQLQASLDRLADS
jgi:valyl-tRNA synthetase